MMYIFRHNQGNSNWKSPVMNFWKVVVSPFAFFALLGNSNAFSVYTFLDLFDSYD